MRESGLDRTKRRNGLRDLVIESEFSVLVGSEDQQSMRITSGERAAKHRREECNVKSINQSFDSPSAPIGWVGAGVCQRKRALFFLLRVHE